jgi:hypothetical protein
MDEHGGSARRRIHDRLHAPHPAARRGIRWWDRQGLRGGLLGGIGFALVELVIMSAQEGQTAVARLLRRIAAMWIGPAALDPDFSFAAVAVIGTVMHLGLSALFGLFLTWLTDSHAAKSWLARSRANLIVVATLYGLLLWPLNVYFIAPFVGWEWFARETEPVVQALAHLCYGALLGLYLNHRLGARCQVNPL